MDNLANAQELTAQEEEAMARAAEEQRLATEQAEKAAKEAQGDKDSRSEDKSKEHSDAEKSKKKPKMNIMDSMVYDGSDPADLIYTGDDKTLAELHAISEEPEKTVIVFRDSKKNQNDLFEMKARARKKDEVPASVRRKRIIPFSSMFCLSPTNS